MIAILLLLLATPIHAENSLERTLASNSDLLSRLGGTLEPADEQAKARLKENVGKALKLEGKDLKILTNPDKKSAWFGGIVIFVDPSGKAFFVDKNGKYYTEDLKDRIIGGTLTGQDGQSALVTLFYGNPGDPDFYSAYFGTTKLKVIRFNLDRDSGNITGSLKLPTGRVLKVTRKGRDNSSVKINGLPLSPLFL